MSTYKEIRGLKVRDYTTNPDNPIEGQLWYNTTDNVAKYQIPDVLSSWSTAVDLPYSTTGASGVGSKTAALIFGGETPSGEVTTTVKYNGTSFSSTGSLNEKAQITLNFGTQTSAIAAGGERTPPGVSSKTEQFNGSAWSETGDLNTARRNGGGSGPSASTGVVFGGGEHPSYNSNTESWNGTCFSETTDLPTGQAGSSAGDSATAALFFGGPINPSPPYISATTLAYNGSAWTTVNSMNTSRRIGPRGSSVGANSSGGAYYAGGNTGSTVGNMETWDGTSWTETGDLNVARYNVAGAGSSTDAIVTSGTGPASYMANTEEFSVNVPIGAWATAADMNNSNFGMGGDGAVTTAIASGGANTPSDKTSKCETFNGTSWTEQSSMNTRKYYGSNAGDSTAGLAFGGEPADPSRADTEKFNGSSWSETANLNTGRESVTGSGTQTLAIAVAGSPNLAITETFNGTSWSEVADLNTGRTNNATTGANNTVILSFGGNQSPKGQTESWNGTSWTEVNDMNTGRPSLAGSGSYTSAIASSSSSSPKAQVEVWNGTIWRKDSDLNTGRDGGRAAGTNNTEGIHFGGRNEPTVYASTEEFSAGAKTTKTISTD